MRATAALASLAAMTRKRWFAVAAAVVVCVLAAGLAVFQPWHLWQDSYVDEALPRSGPVPGAPTDAPTDVPTTTGPDGRSTTAPPPVDDVTELAAGDLEDGEHAADGVARVIELPDGRRFVRFEDLVTSEGPDVHIWITDQPSGGDWGSYDDGRYVRLGELKADHGNQNYEIPADADLDGMRSVVIWCDAFNVAFASAPVDL